MVDSSRRTRFIILFGGTFFLFLINLQTIKNYYATPKDDNDTLNKRSGDDCNFGPDDKGALPVILMAFGRSGSSVTWDLMAQLTGESTIAYEITGGNSQKSVDFFEKIPQKVGERWARKKLCYIQKRNSKDAGIIGFQWKPYQTTFSHRYAVGALKDIGESVDPPIRVVYLLRNPIDRKISNLRHSASNVTAHCNIGDEECIKNHHNSTKRGVEFPIGNELLSWLRHDKKDSHHIRDQLSHYGVRHIEVHYEKLYLTESADEWMRIFNFLGVGPAEDLTMHDVRSKFSMAATSTTIDRSETILNFGKVKETLNGTEFIDLL